MRKLIILAVIFLLFSGCAKEENKASANYGYSIKEIQEKFNLDDLYEYEEAVLVLIPDEDLWNEMHMQLVTYKNEHGYLEVLVIVNNNETLVSIKPYWGSYTFEYILADLDNDNETELIGFYDWGSGIIRSQLFVMEQNGKYTYVKLLDKINPMYTYRNLYYNDIENVVTADAFNNYNFIDIELMKLYYEEGRYYCEHVNKRGLTFKEFMNQHLSNIK